MVVKNLILVGPDPLKTQRQHPGGQLTAMKGLVAFLADRSFQYHIINTAQNVFPMPSLMCRTKKALRRIISFLLVCFQKREGTAAIVMSSGGLSFIEKIVMCGIARILDVPHMLLLRSGHFRVQAERSKFLAWLFSFCLRIPCRIVVQGTGWVSFLEGLGVDSSRVHVVYNWLPPDVKKLLSVDVIRRGQFDEAPFTFVFVGWLVREKGVWELLEAVNNSLILRDCRVVLIGDGSERESLEKYIKDKKLTGVCITGWLPHDEVVEFLKVADAFVLPSYMEGFPNALLEAMACGLPVIATPVGAIPDSAKDFYNAFLVPVANEGALRNAMEQLVYNPVLAKRMGELSSSIVEEQHDWEKNCTSLIDLFADC